MKIVQLSDTHVTCAGVRVRGDIEPADWLQRAIERTNTSIRPDLVIVTGDIVDRGTRAEYERARQLLERLDAPYLVIVGNHDDRDQLVQMFGYRDRISTKRCNYVVDDYPLRVVAIDSAIHHWPGGYIDGETLEWLERTLGSAPDRPTLLLMHHPPAPTGIALSDLVGVRGSRRLGSLLAGRTNVVRVLSGHIHRVGSWSWMGTTIATTGSTAPLFLPEILRGRLSYRAYPAVFAVHTWRAGALSTENIGVDGPAREPAMAAT